MVKSGQPRRVDFVSSLPREVPVEVIDRGDLVQRVGWEHLHMPERLTFPLVMVVWSGGGRHVVDFEDIELRPGRVVTIAPGQVHRYDPGATDDATLVLSNSVPLAMGSGSAASDLDASSVATARSLIDALRIEQGRADGDAGTDRLMRALFEALAALIDRARPSDELAVAPEPYRVFMASVEANLALRSVGEHARRLGYSERTLSRACLDVRGLTAKQVLVQRITLEAKRLLAHTDLAASSISRQLGFGEPSNFQKFFEREVGLRPSQFRAAQR